MNEMNGRFDLDHQRKSNAADVQISDEEGADFSRFVDRSVLPLMLRDARAAGLTLCSFACSAARSAEDRRDNRRRCAST